MPIAEIPENSRRKETPKKSKMKVDKVDNVSPLGKAPNKLGCNLCDCVGYEGNRAHHFHTCPRDGCGHRFHDHNKEFS